MYVTYTFECFYCVEMKRNSQIVPLFERHEAKKIGYSSTPLVADDEQTEDDGILSACLGSAPPVQSYTESENEI
jgi:hypothetical protein